MEFGFAIPTLTTIPKASESPDGGWRIRYQRSHDICGMAEALGYHFATIGHHRFTAETIQASAPFVVLAALAARTTRLKFCTSIALLPLQDPIEFAEQAATLDELSDGRLIVGVGIGYRPYEFEMIGLDYKHRVPRLEEAIEILRRAWGDAPVHFEGKHFQVHGANVVPKPVQKPGPPIWVGAQVDAAVLRAARIGDGYIVDSSESLEALVPRIEMYRGECAKFGKPPTVSFNRKVGIAETREQVEAEWLPAALDVYRTLLRRGSVFQNQEFAENLKSGKPLKLADCPPGQFIAGTPADCIEAIQWCREATACDYLVADFGRGAHGEPFERARARIELFGREVLPTFRRD